MTKIQIFPIAVAAALASFGAASAAQTIYSNVDPAADQHAIIGLGGEYGDEIVPVGGSRFVQTFRFDYVSNYDLKDGARFRIYSNDGAAGAPKTLLYNSPAFDIQKNKLNEYNVITLSLGGTGLRLPNDRATWTVSFNGIGGDNEAGILLYDKPTVGQSGNDFWVKNGSIWSLQKAGLGKVANFAAQVTAVPEPSTYALLGIGAFAMVAIRRFRK
ncbi:MAG: PEP-CTERM sorting domain-containing protein [Pedosphaera sp.]|nr:PEP-CTERM sorting domain-containing protein [Pedosphaera sp.]